MTQIFRDGGPKSSEVGSRVRLFPRKLTVVFVAVAAATVAGAALSSQILDARRAEAEDLASTWQALAAIEHMHALLGKAEASCREHAATGSAVAGQRYAAARRDAAAAIEQLRVALAGSDGGLEHLAVVSADLRQAFAALDRYEQRIMRQGLAVNSEESSLLRGPLEKAENAVTALAQTQMHELAESEVTRARTRWQSDLLIMGSGAALLLLIVTAAFAVRGHLSEREQREREHEQVVELQQRLIGIVGHDLRTPLNAIAGSAALLARAPDLPSSRTRAAERIVSSAGRMSRMIRDLIEYSRTRAGSEIAVHLERIDVGELCKQVAQEVCTSRPGCEVRISIDGDMVGEWDPSRMGQVFSNLLGNACAHGEPGSSVRVKLRGTTSTLMFDVHNKGPPIPEDLLPYIFEPFKKGIAQTGRGEGLGLGLYIVRTFVEAHGGTVKVASGAKGTTFRVELPRMLKRSGARVRRRFDRGRGGAGVG